jgi:hypothetical protein
MVRLIQKGNPAAMAGSDNSLPPTTAHRVTRTCDECGSPFFVSASHMASLCPECAHYLYGTPACAHELVAGHCTRCGWNGSESPFVARVKADRHSDAPFG